MRARAASRPVSSVVTRMRFAASLEQTWNGLRFYEEIAKRPPLHLRFLLPQPIRTVGNKSKVGDVATCLYERGRLLKRVTRIESGRFYEFEVVEQVLEIGGGIRLSGGSYRMRGLEDGSTEVALTTRYASPERPRWMWKPIEAAVCRSFHRHILGAMRSNVESRGSFAVAGRVAHAHGGD